MIPGLKCHHSPGQHRGCSSMTSWAEDPVRRCWDPDPRKQWDSRCCFKLLFQVCVNLLLSNRKPIYFWGSHSAPIRVLLISELKKLASCISCTYWALAKPKAPSIQWRLLSFKYLRALFFPPGSKTYQRNSCSSHTSRWWNRGQVI